MWRPGLTPRCGIASKLTMAATSDSQEISITGWAPGTLGQVVSLHGRYYAREWGFGPYFEAKVAAGMAEFIPRMDPARDLFLAARRGGHLLASITIDGSESAADEAHLRWFITSDKARGTGLGLAIVHEIARAHGGTIRCMEAASGSGTRFELELPLHASTSSNGDQSA